MDKGQGRTVADIRNTGTIVLLEEQGSSNIGDGQQSLAGNDSDRGSIVDRRGSSPRR